MKIAVAPYHYLCDGQLTNCVPQPDTTRQLDAQGDKLMQRLVYRKVKGHESIVALHSVNTTAGGGGVRWYEFRLDKKRDPVLYQQGTYAPDGFFRWMGSIGMDRKGDIAMGYSFGGAPNFAGQRFAARLAGDPKGLLTFHEQVLVAGEAPANHRQSLGRLHHHRHGPRRRLHLLVCRRLSEEGRHYLLHAHRSLSDTQLQVSRKSTKH